MLLEGKSLTVRLTVLFATVSSSVLLFLGVVVGHLVDRHFAELDNEALTGKFERIQQTLAKATSADALEVLPSRLDAALVGERDLSVRIRTEDGQSLYAAGVADLPAQLTGEGMRLVTAADGQPLRLLSGRTALGIPGNRPVVIEVATGLSHHASFMGSFRIALWTTVATAAFASGMLGWTVARRGLAPLREISADAARITAERLDRRVPAAELPVELAVVAQAVNQMLSRLQDSFRRLTEFASDIAHELRTPLTNLATQTQVTLSKDRSAAQYREVLGSNAEEYERLTRTIGDMLFLAKTDNDLIVPHREPLDLRVETEAVAEFYAALAEEQGIELSVSGAARASGDRLMLRRAIGNLLSNACRHTPRGGRIEIELAETAAGMAKVVVRNTGETIAAEHLPHLFDRFYRADASRRRDTEGAGLGLAITRSIIRAHGGDAGARSTSGVTEFELRLPR